MPRWTRWRQRYTKNEILAIGIEGDRSSLCGAIKRFERRHGIPYKKPLTLKEQCARQIVLIETDEMKWFLNAYLPSHLFKYVTNDLFDLKRDEFRSNYANDDELCDQCSTENNKQRQVKCRCPKMECAMEKLNKYFFKRMNSENERKTCQSKQFQLIYQLPYVDDGHYSDYCDEEPLYFLYLYPPIFHKEHRNEDSDDMDDYSPYHGCQVMERVSAKDKLLFVDLMRCFGSFETNHQQAKLILYNSFEHEH